MSDHWRIISACHKFGRRVPDMTRNVACKAASGAVAPFVLHVAQPGTVSRGVCLPCTSVHALGFPSKDLGARFPVYLDKVHNLAGYGRNEPYKTPSATKIET